MICYICIHELYTRYCRVLEYTHMYIYGYRIYTHTYMY